MTWLPTATAVVVVLLVWSLSQAPPGVGHVQVEQGGGFPTRAATDDLVARLTAAIHRGGDQDPLLDALRASEAQRANLHRKMTRSTRRRAQ